MSTMVDALMQQLAGGPLQEMSRAIGADEQTTATALAGALPLLVTALARNSASGQGASSLAGAIERDHDGSLLDNLPGLAQMLGGAGGDGILGHILGGQRPAVESGLSRSTGLDPSAIARLLTMAAPLVMAYLGRMQRNKGMSADDMAGYLGQQSNSIQERAPEAGGLFGALLDQNHDGQVADDIARMGMSALGKIFGGR